MPTVVCDIFIKTYHKDFVWLDYCLRSIRTFATGFRNVVVVSDEDGYLIPEHFCFPQVKIHYVPLPPAYETESATTPSSNWMLGYVWQQVVKLNWFDYSDADAVLVLDSDWMLTRETCPTDFMTKKKFHWFYRGWETAGAAIRWKPTVENLMQQSALYEAMGVAGFVLTRNTSIAFKIHLCSLYAKQDIWNVLVQNKTQELSEFNLLGTFIYHYSSEYTLLVDVDTELYHNATIRPSWSWAGLSKTEYSIREKILTENKQKLLLDAFQDSYYQEITKVRLNILQTLLPPLCTLFSLKTCIELGSGANLFTSFLVNDLKLETTVVDGRKDIIDLYRDNSLVRCVIKNAIVFNLNLPWNNHGVKYDVVFAYGIIYHLSNQPQFAMTCAQLCNENGIVLIDSIALDPDKHCAITSITESLHPTQALDKKATHSSMSYLHNIFGMCFPFIYLHAKPDHQEYKLNQRTQFIASKRLLTCSSLHLLNK